MSPCASLFVNIHLKSTCLLEYTGEGIVPKNATKAAHQLFYWRIRMAAMKRLTKNPSMFSKDYGTWGHLYNR